MRINKQKACKLDSRKIKHILTSFVC